MHNAKPFTVKVAITTFATTLSFAIAIQSAHAQIGGPPGPPSPPAVAAPAPLAAPPPPPGAPSALATPATVPQLAPAPAMPSVSLGVGLPTPRVFSCACGGPGVNTQWTGQVTSTSYILASQAASGVCSSYKTNSHAQSPFIPPPVFGFSAPLRVPNNPFVVGNALTSSSGVSAVGAQPGSTQPLNIGRRLTFAECSRCSCD